MDAVGGRKTLALDTRIRAQRVAVGWDPRSPIQTYVHVDRAGPARALLFGTQRLRGAESRPEEEQQLLSNVLGVLFDEPVPCIRHVHCAHHVGDARVDGGLDHV